MPDWLTHHLLSVYRFAMHLCGDQHLAEDLTQETMLRALRNMDSLRDKAALRVWLFRIAKNLWTDRHRSKSSVPMVPLDDVEPTDSESDPSLNAEIREEVAITLDAMHQLPERQRTVLHLVACQQFSIGEVAGVLEISSEAVRSNLSLARAQMRKSCLTKDLATIKKSKED